MASLRSSKAPRGEPFLREIAIWLLAAMVFCMIPGVFAGEDVVRRQLLATDFASAREALVEAIEAEGLVVGSVLPINEMLARTAGDLGRPASPFAQAVTVQFCSTGLAWQLIEEDAAQLALCPLSVSLYATTLEPGRVMLAYRSPGATTPGRRKAGKLLERLIQRTAELARLRW
jgi:uncharacterized protein (DUF302 family)